MANIALPTGKHNRKPNTKLSMACVLQVPSQIHLSVFICHVRKSKTVQQTNVQKQQKALRQTDTNQQQLK